MDEDLEYFINRKKREIAEYMRVAKALHFDEGEISKRVDLLLDDLNELLKKRK